MEDNTKSNKRENEEVVIQNNNQESIENKKVELAVTNNEKINENINETISNHSDNQTLDVAPVKHKLHIILSGGGIKGVFQLAFLDELLELWKNNDDYEISSIYGTSVGAILSPIIACKKTKEAFNIIRNINCLKDIFRPSLFYKYLPDKFSTLRLFSKSAMFKDIKLLDNLSSLLSEDDWKTAKEKCNVVAWNIIKKQEEWFSNEDLQFGIKASSALWLMVDPIRKDDEHIYIDGGATELFPVSQLMKKTSVEKGKDIILFIDCDSRKNDKKQQGVPRNSLNMMLSLQDSALEQLSLREEKLLKNHWDSLYGEDTNNKYYYVIRPDTTVLESGIDINRNKIEELEKSGRIKAHLFDFTFNSFHTKP